MKLKLDENLGRRAEQLLLSAGHDVTAVYAQGLTSAPDRDLIQVCAEEARALVTLDLGFANPLIFHPFAYRGIAVLRIRGRATPEDLDDAIQTLIGALADRSIDRKLWIVERGRIREYQPEEEADSE